MMDNESWKDQIMNSLDGAQRADPQADMFEKIKQKMRTAPLQMVKTSFVAVAAACLAFIVALNIWTLMRSPVPGEASSSAYQFDRTNFELYSER